MELLTKLGIDWKLLLAQTFNFLVLLFVLYKFVYRPVLDMLDKRSKTIEKGLKDAQESETRLQEIEKLREQRVMEAEKEVGRLIESARKDADRLKKEMLAATAAQSEELLQKARTQMQEERAKMMSDLKQEVVSIILQATGKMLQREFSSADQDKLLKAISHEMKTI